MLIYTHAKQWIYIQHDGQIKLIARFWSSCMVCDCTRDLGVETDSYVSHRQSNAISYCVRHPIRKKSS